MTFEGGVRVARRQCDPWALIGRMEAGVIVWNAYLNGLRGNRYIGYKISSPKTEQNSLKSRPVLDTIPGTGIL